jgi:hypothetical protein
VPSGARGLAIADDGETAYVPAALLYQLDLRGARAGANTAGAPPLTSPPPVVRKLRIASGRAADEGGAPNSVQRVVEAIALLPWPGTPGSSSTERLIVFTSRSAAAPKDAIRLIDPKTRTATTYDATSLMTALRADESVTGGAGAPLNIVAVAARVCGLWLALFNCGSAPGGRNSVVLIQQSDFVAYLRALKRAAKAAGGSAASKQAAAARVRAPMYGVAHLELPPLGVPAPGGAGGGGGLVNHNAGVSAASLGELRRSCEDEEEDEYLLIAASYETENGEGLGTRLALLPTSALLLLFSKKERTGSSDTPSVDLSDTSALLSEVRPGRRAAAAAAATAAAAASAAARPRPHPSLPKSWASRRAVAVCLTPTAPKTESKRWPWPTWAAGRRRSCCRSGCACRPRPCAS